MKKFVRCVFLLFFCLIAIFSTIFVYKFFENSYKTNDCAYVFIPKSKNNHETNSNSVENLSQNDEKNATSVDSIISNLKSENFNKTAEETTTTDNISIDTKNISQNTSKITTDEISLNKTSTQDCSTNVEKISKLTKNKERILTIKSDIKSKISFIFVPLGHEKKSLEEVILLFPHEISIAVNGSAENKEDLIKFAKQNGHNIVLELPLEPVDFPDTNPGQLTLLTGITYEENLNKLNKILSNTSGIDGVINIIGDRFIQSNTDFSQIINFLKSKDLFFINATHENPEICNKILEKSKIKFAIAEHFFDENAASVDIIEQDLNNFASALKPSQAAIKILPATKNTLHAFRKWLDSNRDKYIFINIRDFFELQEN